MIRAKGFEYARQAQEYQQARTNMNQELFSIHFFFEDWCKWVLHIFYSVFYFLYLKLKIILALASYLVNSSRTKAVDQVIQKIALVFY